MQYCAKFFVIKIYNIMEFFFVILTIGFILLIIGSLIGYVDIINNDKNFGCSKFLFIKL